MIIWPPGYKYLNDIKLDVNKFHKVKSLEIMKIDKNFFETFCFKVYQIDNASKNKILNKIDRLKYDEFNIGVLRVEIEKPVLVAQDALNYVRCKTVNDLKIYIRNKYKDKIKNYVYDVIIHSTEVDYQNDAVLKLLNKYKIHVN